MHQQFCYTPEEALRRASQSKPEIRGNAPIDFACAWTIEAIGPLTALSAERRFHTTFFEIECLMSFTVYGKNPCGGHSEFERVTAAGAVFKAADLVGDGWSGVHISDAKNKIYWPARFNRIPDRFSHVAVVSKPNA